MNSASLRALRSARGAILGSSLAFLIMIVGALGFVAWQERNGAYRLAAQHSRDLALLLEAQTVRLFDSADLILGQAIEMADPLDWQALEGSTQARQKLQEIARRLPYIVSIWIGDETGRGRVSNLEGVIASAAGRDYFKELQRGPGPVNISSLLVAPSTGRTLVIVSRGIYGPDGSFRGFVTAAIDPGFFTRLFQSIEGAFPVRVALVRTTDLSVIATRRPESMATIQEAITAPGVSSILSAREGSWHPRIAGDRVEVRFRQAETYPLLLLVGIYDSDIDAFWITNSRTAMIVAGLSVSFILLLTWSSLRRLRREDQVQAALQDSEQRYAAFVAHTPDPVFLIDGAGGTLAMERVNPAFERLTGLAQRELVGAPLPPALDAVAGLARASLDSDEPRPFSLQVPTGGRARTWEGMLVPIGRRGEPPSKLVGLAHDVTDRLAAENQLRQAQKMEAIGQITGGVAHDFNNLLTVIMANLDRARRRWADRAVHDKALAQAESGAERAATLTRQLLAFARRQPLDPKVIDVNRLVATTAELLRRTIGESIELEMVTAGGLWGALADEGQLQTALMNLAINARDAMPAGGKLTIETANARLDEDYAAQHDEVQHGQYVMIAVTDTGMGMTPEIAERIFEPFFTTKEEGKGTGLGLSQVFGFVKQSGGHVKVYTEPGHGTTMRMYLPRTKLTPQERASEQPWAAARPGETVLVLEDDPDVRRAVVAMIEDLGYAVLEAETGAQAIAIVESSQPIDILFSDIVLPGGMGGRVVADRAAQIRPGLKVLFTSGYTENAIIHHGRLDEGVHLLSKPYHQSQLAAKLRSVLDG